MTLPVEKVGDTSIAKFVAPIVATLLTLVAINVAMYFHLERAKPNKGFVLVEQKWQMLKRQNEPVDWLILGDSSCNQGVDPSIIADKTGKSALNLCSIGFMLLAQEAWMLHDYLERVGEPEHVVIGHVYDVWNLDDKPLRTLAPRITTDAEFFAAQRPPLDVSQFYLWVQRYVPIYAQKKTMVMYATDPRTLLIQKSYHFNEDGFMPEPDARPKNVETDLQGHLAFVRQRFAANENDPTEPVFQHSKMNRDAIDELKAIAAKFPNTKFHLVASPVHEALLQDDVWNEYYQLVRGDLESRFAGSNVLLHLDPVSVSPDMLQNADHVTTEGARIYTERVVEKIVRTEENTR